LSCAGRSTDHRSAPEQSYHPSGTHRRVQERECAHEVWLELRNLNFPMPRSSGLLTPPDSSSSQCRVFRLSSAPKRAAGKVPNTRQAELGSEQPCRAPLDSRSSRIDHCVARGRAQMHPSGPIQECRAGAALCAHRAVPGIGVEGEASLQCGLRTMNTARTSGEKGRTEDA
jgi:hypothetical protein